MRRFHPLHLAAAVAIALTSSAIAQTTTSGTVRAAPAATPTSTGTPSASPVTSSANTSSSGVVTTTTPTPGVRGESGASQSTLSETLGGQSAGGSGSAMGSNQTTVDPATTRPGSFEPGGAFGPPGSTATTNRAAPSTLPGNTGALVMPASGTEGVPQNSTQQTVVIQQPQSQTRVATPIFDEAAREGRAKERQRRAQGNEPRVYGIAPRTDNDLTHQMPDDPIIRY